MIPNDKKFVIAAGETSANSNSSGPSPILKNLRDHRERFGAHISEGPWFKSSHLKPIPALTSDLLRFRSVQQIWTRFNEGLYRPVKGAKGQALGREISLRWRRKLGHTRPELHEVVVASSGGARHYRWVASKITSKQRKTMGGYS